MSRAIPVACYFEICKLSVDAAIDRRKPVAYTIAMIKSFKNKELASLWQSGKSKIDARMHRRILMRLDRLNASGTAEDMNLPGYDFHALKGFKPTRYAVHVNGPWRLTFEFQDGDALMVDFEQYR